MFFRRSSGIIYFKIYIKLAVPPESAELQLNPFKKLLGCEPFIKNLNENLEQRHGRKVLIRKQIRPLNQKRRNPFITGRNYRTACKDSGVLRFVL
ncbi:hypothetical protein MSVAZ_0307 [Methanosarcina vacuolata Z-761]|uniref:Uncharacterized protein n=1 Tax=Methanosarcina vacuolata Z-761 TaxID=1434123 RepID=A0A0E3LGI4_9EURY|nr:hypothetical protein MSVAZ_0307 [Methanosarcina vacuolata Z-761]